MDVERARQKALEALREIDRMERGEGLYDAEQGHKDADGVLMDLLREIGMADVADEFDNLRKWYS